jgi:hypothetical protein
MEGRSPERKEREDAKKKEAIVVYGKGGNEPWETRTRFRKKSVPSFSLHSERNVRGGLYNGWCCGGWNIFITVGLSRKNYNGWNITVGVVTDEY